MTSDDVVDTAVVLVDIIVGPVAKAGEHLADCWTKEHYKQKIMCFKILIVMVNRKYSFNNSR